MSDDEGPGDYAGEDDLGGIAALDEDVTIEAQSTGETDVESHVEESASLEGDEGSAAASEDSEEDEPEEADDETAAPEDDADAVAAAEAKAAVAAAKAETARARVDPLLRISNRPRVVRIVPDDERVTDNRLHKAEAAQLLSMRAEQIAAHPTAFTEAPGLHDPVEIAYKELFDRRSPLKLRRVVGTGPAGELLVEEWDVRTMTLPALTRPAT